MKMRNDFVTNSSSSSYVIAYRKMPELDNETLHKYPWLKGYGELLEKTLLAEGDCSDTTKGKIAKTKEELDQLFIDRYGWGNDKSVEDVIAHDDEGMYERYEEMRKHVENGFNILFKNIDNDDDVYMIILANMAKDNENLVILEDE